MSAFSNNLSSLIFVTQKWFIQKKFTERFTAKNTRLLDYANQYALIVSENIRNEVNKVVEKSKERFNVCISSFNDFEKSIETLNEKVKNHTSVSNGVENWLRKAEEIITSEPKWKVQVRNMLCLVNYQSSI